MPGETLWKSLKKWLSRGTDRASAAVGEAPATEGKTESIEGGSTKTRGRAAETGDDVTASKGETTAIGGKTTAIPGKAPATEDKVTASGKPTTTGVNTAASEDTVAVVGRAQKGLSRSADDCAADGAAARTREAAQDDRFAPPHREARSLKRTLLMVSDSLERAQIADYVQLLNSPRRLIRLNLLAGLFRGVGMALGFTLLAAIIIYVMTRSFLVNLPIVGDFLGELVWIIQQYLRGKT